MKRKRNYLLAAFLLAMGMLTGCAGRSTGPQDALSAEMQEAEVPETGPEDAETLGAEVGEEETEGAEIQEAKIPETEVQEGETGEAGLQSEKTGEVEAPEAEPRLSEDGTYTSKEEVAEYIYLYEHLPDNFITKKEAKELGWVSSEGNLGQVAPGKSIGGDYFGNFEGNLPEKKGREYHECDIDSDGGYRGAKRIVYSNDGLIYYTEDHYETFELLYGEE